MSNSNKNDLFTEENAKDALKLKAAHDIMGYDVKDTMKLVGYELLLKDIVDYLRILFRKKK